MILIEKRDGSREGFDHLKVSASFWRALGPAGQPYERARYLADAVAFVLSTRPAECVTSAAVFEMGVKVLAHAGLHRSVELYAGYRSRRNDRRKRLCIRHERGLITQWDKSWLAELTRQAWSVRPTTARIIAGAVEHDLLAMDDPHATIFTRRELPRKQIIDQLTARIAELGLADTVTV
ncbi:MAG: hypothetical protein FWE88_05245 [Phycisphaerae bacterium]|nr:hypothetical protein [Phycisphaerae bacterium]